MANVKNLGINDLALPLTAQAVLGDATGGDNDLLKSLLLQLLGEQVEQRNKEKDRKERMAYMAAQDAKQQTLEKAREQDRCSHKKQDNVSTRLAGQYVSGTNQLVLCCQWCHKEFYSPALLPGQVEPPAHLIPPPDERGS